MENALLTGGTGFIGRDIKPYLEKVCNLYAPKRAELNLYDEQKVREYICQNKIDVVIHSANPNPAKNQLDKQETMFEDSIRIFMNLFKAQDCYQMMYTFGSGAEYDKSKDACLVTEEEETRSVPYDSYGLAKFTMNQIIGKNDKQCNLRIFACYGPTDHESKFITHVIHCCMRHEDITIRQDCYFDYMQVTDLARVVEYFLNNTPKYHSYNVCTGIRTSLSDIARIVKRQMNSDSNIVIFKEGWNKEYTGSNARLMSELGNFDFITLEDGIKMQIESELREGLRI